MLNRPEHAPLYFVLARAWAQVFGGSVGAMRAFPAVTSLFTLPLFYWLARLLFNSATTAKITLCLACVSPILIRYAQEARPYSLWMVGILASSVALLSALHSNRRSAWAIYSLTVALTFWTHLLSGPLFIAHSLYVLILRRYEKIDLKAVSIHRTNVEGDSPSASTDPSFQRPSVDRLRLLNFRKFLSFGLLAILPWLGQMFSQFESVQAVTEWQSKPLSLGDLMGGWLNNVSRLSFFWMPPGQWLMFVAFWLLLFAWCLFCLLSSAHLRQWLLPVLLCVIPGGLLVGLDLVFGGIRSLVPHYSMPTYLGAIFVLSFGLSFGVSRLQRPPIAKGRRYFQAGLFHIVLVLMIFASWNNLRSPVWWKDSQLYSLSVAQAVTQTATPITFVSDYRVGNFMSVGLMLRPTDRFLWFREKELIDKGVDVDRILGSADNIFLFRPSEYLLDRVEDGAEQRQLAVEEMEIQDIYKISRPMSQ
nr:glycosyltransferase family 39 protein [cf. Phormidesmis sp. LEGE 11477]